MNRREHVGGKGTLIIIGGHEDKENDCVILREVADRLNGGRLVISTVASHEPEGYFESYRQAFGKIGLTDLVEIYVEDRSETLDSKNLDVFDGATGVFFSGGDQLRISSQIGDTPFESLVRRVYEQGGVVAGTSAGASVMGESMLIKGSSGESSRIGNVHLAPGLGFIRDTIIDQHFAERGRIGRLLGAVALNPRMLGIGIDEDTALVVSGNTFSVIGKGAVYVVDASGATHSNIAEAKPESVVSMHNVTLHVLSSGECFDLASRSPVSAATTDEEDETHSKSRSSRKSQKATSRS